MARIEFNIVALGDFSAVNAQVKALQAQVDLLNKSVVGVGIGSQLTKDLASAQAAFKSTMLSTGQFTLSTVKMSSETEKFGQALVSGKLRLSEYFQIITGKAGQATASLAALTAEQVKLSNSVIMSDASKKGMLSVYTPTTINAVTDATKMATMQQNMYNLSLEASSKALVNWGKNTQWAGRQLTVGLTMPMVMFGAVAVKSFKETNIELTRLQRLYGVGLLAPSTAQITDISNKVMELSKKIAITMGIAQKDTTATAADFAAIGRTGDSLLTSTEQAMRLSKLGGIDAHTAFTGIMSLQNTFKVSSTDLAESVNFLTAIQKQTALNLTDITDALPRIGPIVKQLGGTYKDTAVMMLSMKEAGVPAAQAANAIKSAMASLISPTAAAKDMFGKFNINLENISKSTGGNPVKMIQELQKGLEGIEPLARAQLIEKLFGKFQFARVTAMLDNLGKAGSQTQLGFKIAAASAKDLSTLISQEMKIATESTTAKWARAMEGFKATLYPIGQKFMEMGTMILNVANKIGHAFSSLPGPIKTVLGFFIGGAAIAGPIIMLTGLMANFAGYILKAFLGIKSLITGGMTFKQLLTPEIIAAQNAANLFSTEISNDVNAVDLLDQAIKRLSVTLEGLSVGMAMSAGGIGANVAEATALANSSAISTRNGIYHQMAKEEYGLFGYKGKDEFAKSKPTSGFYGVRDESLNKAMANTGVAGEKIVAAMTAYTGEVNNASTMFRTSATDYLGVIAKKTDVQGKSLITEEQAAEINAQINTEYKLWLEAQTLVTDETNQLAAITNRIMLQAAEASANPAEFQRMWGNYNTSRSLTTTAGKGAGGGGNVIPVQSEIYTQGPKGLVLSGSDTKMFYHSYNEEFLKFRESIVNQFREAMKKAGIVGSEALIAEVDKGLIGVESSLGKLGTTSVKTLSDAGRLDALVYIDSMEAEVAATAGNVSAIAAEKITAETSMFANAGKKAGLIMGAAMGISMTAMMGGAALSGKGGAVGTAGSVLTNVGMGAMALSFLPIAPELYVPILAGIAALTIAYKGLSKVMADIKFHNAEIANSYKASGDAISLFGGTLADQTIRMHSFAKAVVPAVLLSQTQQNADAIIKLDPKTSGLRQTSDLLKNNNTASSVIGTAKQFAAAQVANGMDPAKVTEMVTAMLTYAGKTQYLKQALIEIGTSTKDVSTATNTWISKLKSAAFPLNATQVSYNLLSSEQKRVADSALQVANTILSTNTSFSDAVRLAAGLTIALGGTAQAYQYLALAASKMKDTGLVDELAKLQSAGVSSDQALIWAKASAANPMILGQSAVDRNKQILNAVRADIKSQNIQIQSENAAALIDYNNKVSTANAKTALDKKSVLALAQKELKLLKDKLSAEQKVTAELKARQQYQQTQADLDSQIRLATASGDFMQAALLGQQKKSNAADFTNSNKVSVEQAAIDAKQAQVDKLQLASDIKAAVVSAIGPKPVAKPLIVENTVVNQLAAALGIFADGTSLRVTISKVDPKAVSSNSPIAGLLGKGASTASISDLVAAGVKPKVTPGTSAINPGSSTYTGQTFTGTDGKRYKVGSMVPYSQNVYSIQSFAVGTPYVQKDMIAQIHKGERIIPASQNNDTMGGTYNITVNAGSNASADDIAKTVIDTIKRQDAMTSTNRSMRI